MPAYMFWAASDSVCLGWDSGFGLRLRFLCFFSCLSLPGCALFYRAGFYARFAYPSLGAVAGWCCASCSAAPVCHYEPCAAAAIVLLLLAHGAAKGLPTVLLCPCWVALSEGHTTHCPELPESGISCLERALKAHFLNAFRGSFI